MSIERYSIIGILFSIFIIIIDLYLLRKRKISGGTFTRWFIIGFGTGIVSSVPSIFNFFYTLLGTDVLISAVTATSFMVLLLLIFYMDYRLNDLNDKVVKLVAKMSANDYDPNQKDESEDKSEYADEEG